MEQNRTSKMLLCKKGGVLIHSVTAVVTGIILVVKGGIAFEYTFHGGIYDTAFCRAIAIALIAVGVYLISKPFYTCTR